MRQTSPTARSEISRKLDLTMPTVARIIDELIEDDMVRSTGETTGSTGRPRELLEFNAEGGVVIGIDLGGTKLYGALSNLGGSILGDVYQKLNDSSGEESFSLVTQMIEKLVKLAAEKEKRLLGIAVGAPGVTHVQSGVVEWAPALNWRNFPLKSRVAEVFNYPVVVDNDVNLAVLGEQWFGTGCGVNNMVLLGIGTGLGAGLVIDGVLYRGHNEGSGEVGYLLPNIEALNHRYDQFGAMESIVSGTGITDRARAVLTGKWDEDTLAKLKASQVFYAARKGEDWAVGIVNETIDYLSMVIVNIATLLNPELIVLSGGVSNSTDMLIQPILERIDGVIQHVPRLEVSTLGSQATVMGAISLILHLTKDYYVVRRLN